MSALAAAFLSLWIALPASGAPAAPAAKELLGEDVELKTPDGWTLKAKYQYANPGQQTFVLLHGKGQRKEGWLRLAARLSKAGYGYLAMDLRGHGQSATGPDGKPAPWRSFKFTKSENDFANMALDIQAAVSTLTARGVAEETVGLIGTDVGGSVALKYAAVHPLVPMIVLLSPGMKYEEVLTVNAMRAYKNRPILMIYAELDKHSAQETPILHEFAKRSAGERNATVLSVPNLHGVRLMTSSPVISKIIDWIASPVKPETAAASTGTVSIPVDAVSSGSAVGEDLSPEQ